MFQMMGAKEQARVIFGLSVYKLRSGKVDILEGVCLVAEVCLHGHVAEEGIPWSLCKGRPTSHEAEECRYSVGRSAEESQQPCTAEEFKCMYSWLAAEEGLQCFVA